MKIYKLAQMSSIMYYVKDYPDKIVLTPDPEIAKRDVDYVPAYKVPYGKYYNSDNYNSFSKTVVQSLKNKGYAGAIYGNYLHMFDKDALIPIGSFNFNNDSSSGD